MFEGWPAAGSKDDDKRRLMDQAMMLDSKYPGGLEAYVSKVGDLVGSFVWVGGGSGFSFVTATSFLFVCLLLPSAINESSFALSWCYTKF